MKTRKEIHNVRQGRSTSDMTVREAGQKGGQKVRELIERGKRSTEK